MRTAKTWLTPLLFVAAFLAVRFSNLTAPFVNLLDTGFQEAIALHHLPDRMLDNHLLPVISQADGVKIFHTAHPPLLHLLYAVLYKIFGLQEWVSRAASLSFYLASLGLWFSCLLGERRLSWLLFAPALFLPLPFALALTTNYEPLSLFSVTLVAAAFFRWQKNPRRLERIALLGAVLLAALSDWPAYLAVPALLLGRIRSPQSRRFLLWMLLLEGLLFAAILFWQKSVTGEAVFFSHAITRNNPLALWQPETYFLLRKHLFSLLGPAPLLLLVILFLTLLRSGPAWSPGLKFFLVYFPLLFLAAPQLVSKHEVYLYYLIPVLVFIAHDALSRSPRPVFLLAILLAVSFPLDYRHAAHRNHRYYFLAQEMRQHPDIKLAFSTPAVGAFRYYSGIETFFPTSTAAVRQLQQRPFDLVALDLRNPEVAFARDEIRKHQDRLRPRFAFAEEQYYIRTEMHPPDFYLAALHAWPESGDWRTPRPEVIPTPSGPAYALRQHPAGQLPLIFSLESLGRARLNFAVAIQHPFPRPVQSDGAGLVMFAEADGGKHLLFARWLRDPDGRGAFSPEYSAALNFSGPVTIYLITDPGPKRNFGFDDACWVSARVIPEEGIAP